MPSLKDSAQRKKKINSKILRQRSVETPRWGVSLDGVTPSPKACPESGRGIREGWGEVLHSMLDITGIKKIIFIIGALIIVSIVVIFIITIRVTKEPIASISSDDELQDISADDIQLSEKVSIPEYTPQPISEEERKEREIERFVAVFIERFGTFSNQNEFSNLESLKMMTTASFYQWAKRYALGTIVDDTASLYYGMTTQALNVSRISADDDNGSDKRVYHVTTQRAEVRGFDGNTKLFSQDADIELVQEGNQWLVSGVFWKSVL